MNPDDAIVPLPEPEDDDDDDQGIEKIPPELLEDVPPEARDRIIEFFHERLTIFAGPIPHPEILSGYEQIVPGSGDRIIKMAESEQRQQHLLQTTEQQQDYAIQTKLVDAGIVAQAKGLDYAYRVTVVALIAGAALLALGQSLAGLVAWAAAITTLAAPFFKREYDKRQAAKPTKSDPDDKP